MGDSFMPGLGGDARVFARQDEWLVGACRPGQCLAVDLDDRVGLVAGDGQLDDLTAQELAKTAGALELV